MQNWHKWTTRDAILVQVATCLTHVNTHRKLVTKAIGAEQASMEWATKMENIANRTDEDVFTVAWAKGEAEAAIKQAQVCRGWIKQHQKIVDLAKTEAEALIRKHNLTAEEVLYYIDIKEPTPPHVVTDYPRISFTLNPAKPYRPDLIIPETVKPPKEILPEPEEFEPEPV